MSIFSRFRRSSACFTCGWQCVPQNILYPAIPCTVEKALDHPRLGTSGRFGTLLHRDFGEAGSFLLILLRKLIRDVGAKRFVERVLHFRPEAAVSGLRKSE